LFEWQFIAACAQKQGWAAVVQRGWMRTNDETGLKQIDWGFATGGERPAGMIYHAVALFLFGNNWDSHAGVGRMMDLNMLCYTTYCVDARRLGGFNVVMSEITSALDM
jgi:hypothetical protein